MTNATAALQLSAPSQSAGDSPQRISPEASESAKRPAAPALSKPTLQAAGKSGSSSATTSPTRARSPRRGTKTHVASACFNCKKAHLACDVSRPCRRCVTMGKTDTCYDVQHKKRGRPKLKDRRVGVADRKTSPGTSSSTGVSPALSAVNGTAVLRSLPMLSAAAAGVSRAGATLVRGSSHQSLAAPQPQHMHAHPLQSAPQAEMYDAGYGALVHSESPPLRHGWQLSREQAGSLNESPQRSPVESLHYGGMPAKAFHAMHSASSSPPHHQPSYFDAPLMQRRHSSLENLPKIHQMADPVAHSALHSWSMPTSRDHSSSRYHYPLSPPHPSSAGAYAGASFNGQSPSPPLLAHMRGHFEPSPHLHPISSVTPPHSQSPGADVPPVLALRMTLADLRIATASEAARDLWAYSPMDLLGLPLGNLVHDSDQEKLGQMQSMLARILLSVAGCEHIAGSPAAEAMLAYVPADISNPAFHQPAQPMTRNTPMALHPDTAGPCPPATGWPQEASVDGKLHIRVCGGAYKLFRVRMYIGGPNADLRITENWNRAFVVCEVHQFSIDLPLAVDEHARRVQQQQQQQFGRPQLHSLPARPQAIGGFFSGHAPARQLPTPSTWAYTGPQPPMSH
ncbi:hypothetical protein THASP1DRAFT_28707 [Thamnocephalis sphaerospora]|uniref:Zn(2)-C6 fungal-type domain-containing protein n=1 Tax=Thamnocephalis sphaerospora TaxID=78915 RepID=A0A4P9XU81_9FUNG|nr:hypothetical protein THASP1DRAFT_28707 [Thamnocephalis sphaerospora]|eukprot:RKP09502.1 hypothetical protein THASP1DRAFT_28707 [Thamnocephalis sphaerospora]